MAEKEEGGITDTSLIEEMMAQDGSQFMDHAATPPPAQQPEELKVSGPAVGKQKPDPEVDFLKTHFPDATSWDEVKQSRTKYKEVSEEHTKIKTEYEQTKADLEKMQRAMKGLESGVDPKYVRLQKLEKDNPVAADVYREFISNKMSAQKKIEAALKLEDPFLAENEKMLRIEMEDKYPIFFDTDLEEDTPEYERESLKMKRAEAAADRKLNEYFSKVEIPAIESAEQKKERIEKVFNTWKGYDFKTSDLTVVNVSLPGKEGASEHFMDIEIPAQEKYVYLKAALHYILDNGLQNEPKNVSTLKKYVNALWIGNNLEKYNAAIIQQKSKMSDKELRQFIHNPGKFNQGSAGGGQGVSNAEDFIDSLPSVLM